MLSPLKKAAFVKVFMKQNPGCDFTDSSVKARFEREYQANLAAEASRREKRSFGERMSSLGRTGLNVFYGLCVLLLLGYCVQIKREEANRTPEQVAADNAKAQREALDKKYSSLRGNAEDVLNNYLLASGQGMCESLQNVKWSALRYGTAVYQYAKREPSVTGAYSVECVYHINGDKLSKAQTYWFQVTIQESSRQREGKILLENQAEIERNLQFTKFQDTP